MTEMVGRAATAIEATPNLFTRVNKFREDGLIHEICWPAIEPEVIAAYRDREEAYIRMQQLQRRAWATRVIEALRDPTPEVCQAVYRAATLPPHPTFGDTWTASSVWQAGVDAALGRPADFAKPADGFAKSPRSE